MPVNPSIKPDLLNNPTERANTLNDPKFSNEQGYFPYDLTHSEFITPRFGQVVPSMHLDTVPGDRTLVHDNCKTILNQISGNMLSTVNQYVDSFYIPLRSVFPTNYEKLIPQPTKGDDLPNAALPQVPFGAFIYDYLNGHNSITIQRLTKSYTGFVDDIMNEDSLRTMFDNYTRSDHNISYPIGFVLGRLALLATILSRGQLLDYLGIAFDTPGNSTNLSSVLQQRIDTFLSRLHTTASNFQSLKINPDDDLIDISQPGGKTIYSAGDTLSEYRNALDDAFEAGRFVFVSLSTDVPTNLVSLGDSAILLIRTLKSIFNYPVEKSSFIETVNSSSNPWRDGSFLNIGKVLAYQQAIAHYYTNDSVDNIFTSELFMQLLRGIMYPATDAGFTQEPVFTYNGVSTEYDYISCGAFFSSLIRNSTGVVNRQYIYSTVMFLLRRSLRYGDYFSTARPDILALSGQLSIDVSGGSVSPIDITKNLLMQRYKNAANYIGSGFPQYYASMYGVVPSDLGCTPRFLAHRKIVLQSLVTNNTADNQGAQTTNLAGYSDNNAFDVFIDDLGYIISLTSYDVLPVYKSGIDNSYHFSDRFDYFNSMLQGIGDQPIRSSEVLGTPALYESIFGYTMRNAEYKYKLSKAHGAFVNSLPGYLLSYPLQAYVSKNDDFSLTINPDFIRDKPAYIDSVVPHMTGISPAEYYHFVCAFVNQVHCARKIQATPPVLF